MDKEQKFQELKKKKNIKDTFLNALNFEKSNQAWADEWYKKHLNASVITRWDWDDIIGHRKQQDDIDCTIQTQDSTLNISEKFRSEDWGDMFIEIYSMYPSVPGWAIKSNQVDLIAYHTPVRSYLINAEQIKNLAKMVLINFDKSDNKEEIIKKGNGVGNAKIANFKNPDLIHDLKINYKAIKTIRPSGTWIGVGFCITWNKLKELGVKYKEIVNYNDCISTSYNDFVSE